MTIIPLLFQKLGWPEILLILAVILLVLGPTQIPKLVKTFKNTRKEIKDVMKEEEEEKKSSLKKEEAGGAE
nr:twin-arginine translocase TatA/TatE family subunit [Lachnospiraceae bacterium]